MNERKRKIHIIFSQEKVENRLTSEQLKQNPEEKEETRDVTKIAKHM